MPDPTDPPTASAGDHPAILTAEAPDGLEIRVRRWLSPAPRGTLVIAHGLGEHSGCYDHVARRLAGPDGLVDVLAPDFRGHGLSPGRRGVVRDYLEFVGDLRAAIELAKSVQPGLPLFLLGHSNGGQVALRALIGGDRRVAGLILSNPMLDLRATVPSWKLGVGRALRRVAPRATLSTTLDHSQLTRDVDAWPARLADELRHRRVSPALFFGMVEGGRLILDQADRIATPTLLLLGESDPIVNPDAARDLLSRLGTNDVTLHAYPEMLHEPLNELGRDRVLNDIAGWLDARLPPDDRNRA